MRRPPRLSPPRPRPAPALCPRLSGAASLPERRQFASHIWQLTFRPGLVNVGSEATTAALASQLQGVVLSMLESAQVLGFNATGTPPTAPLS